MIVVLMKTPTPDDRFRDAEKILDYGFSHVTMVKGISKDRVAQNVWVKNGKQASTTAHLVSDIDYPLINNESPEKYSVSYDIPRVVSAPVKEGEIIGKAVIKYDGKSVGSVDIAAGKVNKGASIGSWLVGVFEGLLVRL